MLKYLLLVVVLIWLFYSPALRGLRGGLARKDKPGAPPATPTPATPAKAENMVQCAHCGVHLPQGDAVQDEQGRRYCGNAHRQAGPASS